MNTICFSIALNGYGSVYRRCLASQADYSRRHGYRFWVIEDVPWRIKAAQCAWLKVEILSGLLKVGADYAAFFDADCEIREHAPRFETEFQPASTMLLAPGKSGRINSGVIFAKHDPSSISFLDTLVANAHVEILKPDAAPYENGHFIHFGRAFARLGYIDHRTWNNNSAYDEVSYVQHYSDGALRKLHESRPVPRAERAKRLVEGYARKLRNRSRPSLEHLPIREFIELARRHFEAEYTRRLRG